MSGKSKSRIHINWHEAATCAFQIELHDYSDSYYKTIGYAGLFIDQTGRRNQYSGLDISLTLLSSHYPRKLMKHLLRERKLRIAKPFPGVYYINKETFTTQIIVTKEKETTHQWSAKES